MRFQHALLHPSALARADSASWRLAVRAACPLCAQPYYAALLRGAYGESDLALVRASAERWLAHECPDHAHAFDLAPAVALPAPLAPTVATR